MMIEAHPLADAFPLIEGEEFNELVVDIGRHGLREPIVLFEGKILDGRNRYRACLAAQVEPRVEKYTGADPVAWVISANLRRRHLTESQRAMAAAKLATMKLGANQHTEGLPIGRASTLLNVGERSVARAREVVEHGTEELQRAVQQGEVSVAAAADIASRPASEQVEIVARGEREILQVAKQIRAEKAEERRAQRIAKLVEISKGNTDLPTATRYPVVLADPPWKFEDYTSEEAHGRAPDYETMTVDQICALPVRDLATETAVLFLWTTSAHLRLAFEVIDAWGFVYSTNMVWVKTGCAPGMGNTVRHQHETLLIARRGDFPKPPPSTRPSSVIMAPRREHSRKPDELYEIIEAMYPSLPKIELFARQKRPGWTAWGNQVATEAAE